MHVIDSNTLRNANGVDITDMESYRHWRKVEAAFEATQEEREMNKKPDIPARVGLALLDWKPDTAARKALEYFFCDYDYGKRPELVSFQELHVSEDDFFVADQRGMIAVYEQLYEDFKEKIKLNKKVDEIKYSSSSVEVRSRYRPPFFHVRDRGDGGEVCSASRPTFFLFP